MHARSAKTKRPRFTRSVERTLAELSTPTPPIFKLESQLLLLISRMFLPLLILIGKVIEVQLNSSPI